jgi:cell division protein FtsW
LNRSFSILSTDNSQGVRRWPGTLRIAFAIALLGVLAILQLALHQPDAMAFAIQQLLLLISATTLLSVFAITPARTLRRIAIIAGVLSYLFLIASLIKGIQIGHIRGWLQLNKMFIQANELIKPFYILSLAWLMHIAPPKWRNRHHAFTAYLLLFVLWLIPVLLSLDLRQSLLYALTGMGIYFVMNPDWLHNTILSCLAILLLGTLLIMHPTSNADRNALQKGGENSTVQSSGRFRTSPVQWRIEHFQRSLIRGSLFGKSVRIGNRITNPLPPGQYESFFAAVAECVGFFGLIPFLGALIGWQAYVLRKAGSTKTVFACAAITGLNIMLLLQGVIHIGINLQLLPPFGMSLPLASYGASMLLHGAISIGITESLLKTAEREKLKSEERNSK